MQHPHLEYVVAPDRDYGWTIRFCELPHGHYARRRAALGAAVDDARRAARRGWDICVIAQRSNGRPRLVWSREREAPDA